MFFFCFLLFMQERPCSNLVGCPKNDLHKGVRFLVIEYHIISITKLSNHRVATPTKIDLVFKFWWNTIKLWTKPISKGKRRLNSEGDTNGIPNSYEMKIKKMIFQIPSAPCWVLTEGEILPLSRRCLLGLSWFFAGDLIHRTRRPAGPIDY
jgi:hypothetical protein